MLKQLNVIVVVISYCSALLIFSPIKPVSVGDTAVLTCNVSNENFMSLAWYRVYNSSWTQSIWFLYTFINQSYATRYTVTTDNTAKPTIFQLTILNVQLHEFGAYECRRNGGGASATGTLSLQTTTTAVNSPTSTTTSLVTTISITSLTTTLSTNLVTTIITSTTTPTKHTNTEPIITTYTSASVTFIDSNNSTSKNYQATVLGLLCSIFGLSSIVLTTAIIAIKIKKFSFNKLFIKFKSKSKVSVMNQGMQDLT